MLNRLAYLNIGQSFGEIWHANIHIYNCIWRCERMDLLRPISRKCDAIENGKICPILSQPIASNEHNARTGCHKTNTTVFDYWQQIDAKVYTLIENSFDLEFCARFAIMQVSLHLINRKHLDSRHMLLSADLFELNIQMHKHNRNVE